MLSQIPFLSSFVALSLLFFFVFIDERRGRRRESGEKRKKEKKKMGEVENKRWGFRRTGSVVMGGKKRGLGDLLVLGEFESVYGLCDVVDSSNSPESMEILAAALLHLFSTHGFFF